MIETPVNYRSEIHDISCISNMSFHFLWACNLYIQTHFDAFARRQPLKNIVAKGYIAHQQMSPFVTLFTTLFQNYTFIYRGFNIFISNLSDADSIYEEKSLTEEQP